MTDDSFQLAIRSKFLSNKFWTELLMTNELMTIYNSYKILNYAYL